MVGFKLYSKGGVSRESCSVCPEESVTNSSNEEEGFPVYDMEMRAFSIGRELSADRTLICKVPLSIMLLLGISDYLKKSLAIIICFVAKNVHIM